MSDVTITIKNLPEDVLGSTWNDVIQFGLREKGDVIVRSDNITIDFNTVYEKKSVFEIMTAAMAEHIILTRKPVAHEVQS